jgi:hypothetical protein
VATEGIVDAAATPTSFLIVLHRRISTTLVVPGRRGKDLLDSYNKDPLFPRPPPPLPLLPLLPLYFFRYNLNNTLEFSNLTSVNPLLAGL